LYRVVQGHYSAGQNLALQKAQSRRTLTRRQQRNALAQRYGHDSNFNRINELCIKQASKETSTAKKPNVLSRLRLKFTDGIGSIIGNRDFRILTFA